ncbi:MAG: hypothetical protein E7621_01685 [Ruminococcaceae bacterium]|nr:hypothetical protein [Oscillospiraceae bacterium]
MNDRNLSYTLGRFRSDVFRVLDEYSCNGKEHEIFSGAVGDMEKRFISAANAAIRLVSLSCDRRLEKKSVVFKTPGVLMKVCDFSLISGEEKLVSLPADSGALSFEFCGKCNIVFCDGDGNAVLKKEIISPYSQLKIFKALIPENASDIIFFCKEKAFVDVKNLKSYTSKSVGYCPDERFLPDGKKLYCEISPECIEISRVLKVTGDRTHPCRCDIFEFSDGVLSCSEKNAGTYLVEYYFCPKELSENSNDNTVIELSPSAFSAAVYATAAELCEREDGELYTRLTYKYREILANCYPSSNPFNRNSFYSAAYGKRRGIRRFFG